MTFGDLLEVLGLAAATAAAYLQWGLTAALVALAIGLIYEGQCMGPTPMPKPKKPKWLRRPKWLRKPVKTPTAE